MKEAPHVLGIVLAGGEMPAGYELLEEEPMESDRVCLWRRR